MKFRLECFRKKCFSGVHCRGIPAEESGSSLSDFRLKENPQIENLMENMIESMLYEYMNEDVINQYSMGLVFLYLLNHLENLSHNSSMDYKETIVQSVLEYINSDCKMQI